MTVSLTDTAPAATADARVGVTAIFPDHLDLQEVGMGVACQMAE